MTTKNIENNLRRRLAKAGCMLRKARGAENADNFGGYMILDANTNGVIAGSRYDLTLKDVEHFISTRI